jgi:ubiquinone/menaquinone biosynthesis C-methylase UbiE
MLDSVYDKIAAHFDQTRIYIWKCVSQFLDSLPPNIFIADVGTGNGKNLRYRNDITIIGNDISENLLKIAKDKNKNNNEFIKANAINLPYRNELFDAVMSVAVLHHIDSYDNRIKFIEELLRITKNNGKILITVWANEQIIKPKWINIKDTDYIIPWHLHNNVIEKRYYHLFSKQEIESILNTFNISYNLLYEMDNWIITIFKNNLY